ncbi:MAG TPA: hypothetical protein VL866_12010, partial [Pyrinomonadaceae bacterium]|nr:hypothetical protein [Pyrinomonadaceae bacterium]
SASRSLRPANNAIPLAEYEHHRWGQVRLHGWRRHVEQMASDEATKENLTPTVSGSQDLSF